MNTNDSRIFRDFYAVSSKMYQFFEQITLGALREIAQTQKESIYLVSALNYEGMMRGHKDWRWRAVTSNSFEITQSGRLKSKSLRENI